MSKSTLIWPEIMAPSYPLKQGLEDNVIRSKAEDGTVKTRPKFTKIRKNYELQWNALPTSEKDILEDFYKNKTKGGSASFEWTDPSDNKKMTVVFLEPISFNLKYRNYWTVTAKLQEV